MGQRDAHGGYLGSIVYDFVMLQWCPLAALRHQQL